MRFIHKIKDSTDNMDTSVIEWGFAIDNDGGCEIFANDSIIFDIPSNGDIKIKVRDGGEQWVKIAKLIKCPLRIDDFTTDYRKK